MPWGSIIFDFGTPIQITDYQIIKPQTEYHQVFAGKACDAYPGIQIQLGTFLFIQIWEYTISELQNI